MPLQQLWSYLPANTITGLSYFCSNVPFNHFLQKLEAMGP